MLYFVFILKIKFKLKQDMLKQFILSSLFISSFSILVNGQEETDDKNLQSYTPSVLINKGSSEIKLFNNLYTQTLFFNEDNESVDAGGRSTFFTSIFEANYGLSKNVSLGAELWFKSANFGPSDSSPLETLNFGNSDMSRTGLSGVGLRIKFNPVKKWTHLSVQSTLLANVLEDPDGSVSNQPFLDGDRHQWITRIFYDKSFGSKFQIFTQLAAWVNIDREFEQQNTNVSTPIDIFGSYFATNKLTFYVQNQFWPSLGSEGISSFFVQSGAGVKYQLFKGFEVEGLYTKFVYGQNTGAGETFNVGFRVIY